MRKETGSVEAKLDDSFQSTLASLVTDPSLRILNNTKKVR